MPLFGNPLELLLIVVIALIVFGPAKLPEIMSQIGRAIGEFRRATSSLSDEFNRTIQAELQESRAVLDETKSAVSDVHSTVTSAVTGSSMPAPARVAAPGELVTAPNGTSTETYGETAANGKLSETPKPPLADTTAWSWETSAAAPSSSSPAAAADVPSLSPSPPPIDSIGASASASNAASPPASNDASPQASNDASPQASQAPAAEPSASSSPPSVSGEVGTSPESSKPTERVVRDELLPPY